MDGRLFAVTLVGVLTAALCGCGGGSSRRSGSVPLVNGHLVGTFGAKDADAALALTDTGGALTLDCGSGTLNQPATPDADGHFDVSGLLSTNVPDRPVRYVGTVTGRTISLSVVQTDTTPNTTRFTFTLVDGQKPSAPGTTPCPG